MKIVEAMQNLKTCPAKAGLKSLSRVTCPEPVEGYRGTCPRLLGIKNLGLILIFIFNFVFLISNWFISGCASTKPVVKSGYNFSNIKKVAVLKFTGTGGVNISNEFISQLLASGINVVDRTDIENITDIKLSGVDAVISGNVIEYNPSSKLLVFKDKNNVIISDRVYPIGGTTVVQDGTVLGTNDANIFSVSSSVSVFAKIIDVSTVEVVWSDTKSYEALDLTTAIGQIVYSFKKALKQDWKDLK